MSNIFFVADTHFGYAKILEYENRPFADIKEMDAALTSNWNTAVGKEDIVFVAGDVSFYNKEKTRNIITRLHGKKILIKGNHDRARSAKWWREVGFFEVYDFPIIYNEWIVIQHEPPTYMNPQTPYFYIYGHVHGTELYKTLTEQSACVSVERWSYTPVSLSELEVLIKKL